ncbi:MAG TPA: PadR family transcriptional regulator [Ktedonobacteraceae bacterium]|jgi:DNA-binding PadR family transcriptional regulator|nr:PadR family transcriptional regulator [Ktedonobacteraceae bacterium]
MYELIVLSLLMRWPIHGYLIVKIMNDQIGPWAKISSGTLYTILNRLEEAGLITVMPQEQVGGGSQGERRSRTFMITDEGRKRFHQLIMDTSSNLGDYQKFFYHKLGYLDLLRPDERLLLINHYINYCQTTILHTQTERESLIHELANHPVPAYLENLQRLMKHIEQNWQAEHEWVRGIREEELAKMET